MTQVVNVKVKYLRPRYTDLRHWLSDPNNVYVGRHGRIFINKEIFHYSASIFNNPFPIDADNPRDTVIDKYRTYILDRLRNEPMLVNELLKLQGKTLGCWCKPDACHGDVLIEILNAYSSDLYKAAQDGMETLHKYFQNNLPTESDLLIVYSLTTNEESQALIGQYLFLLQNHLNTFYPWYPEKNITNLMVIAARDYLPLLNSKKPELFDDLIKYKDIQGKSAVDYAVSQEMLKILRQ